MNNDPILRDIRQARETIFKECNSDLEQYLDYLHAAESKDGDRLIDMEEIKRRQLKRVAG